MMRKNQENNEEEFSLFGDNDKNQKKNGRKFKC
jgi:hypothetical protein